MEQSPGNESKDKLASVTPISSKDVAKHAREIIDQQPGLRSILELVLLSDLTNNQVSEELDLLANGEVKEEDLLKAYSDRQEKNQDNESN